MAKVKAISIIAAAAMMLAMVGCGSNGNDESSKTETSSAVTTEATTEESTEETSEDSAGTTSTVATTSDSLDGSTTADASDSTAEPVPTSDKNMAIADVDTCFSDLNGKTLDEIKSYIESTFPVTDCKENIGAYTMPNGSDKNGLQIDMYTWNFSSPVTIEGVAFDYIAISMGNDAIYNASFNKYDSDTQTASDLKTKAESYGQKTSNEYSDSYNMNCGEVSITLVSETKTLGIDHRYQ